MIKIHQAMIISLFAVLFSNAVYAGPLDNTKIGEHIGDAYLSSSIGGIVVAVSFGQGALGLALAESAMALGLTMMANNLSSSTESEKNLKLLKEIIKREAGDYQMTGEMGIALSAGVTTLKNENTELSDSEAVDALVAAIDN